MMDAQTRKYYDELTERQSKLRWGCLPQLDAKLHVVHGMDFVAERNYVKLVVRYKGIYGEWYRCLAYMKFGFGNLSNNDRARHGLKPIRKRRK